MLKQIEKEIKTFIINSINTNNKIKVRKTVQ